MAFMSTDTTTFAGLRVASFESRRAADMTRLIERRDGVAFVSPSMREVPLAHNQAAIDFANRLITGQIDAVIFLTGVGTRHLIAQIERHVDRAQFLAAVSDAKSVVRGPKPLAALKEVGITPTIIVPEPNTWRELLTTLDQRLPVANLVVGLQEYGVTNPSLIAGLEARGAVVDRIHVYDWDLPEDTGPLEANLRRIVAGEIDVAMFTAAQQVLHLLKLADDLGLADELRDAFRNLVVASIGPTTSETLRATDCRSTWSRRIPRWDTWSKKQASRPPRSSPANASSSTSAIINHQSSIQNPRPGTTACFSARAAASRSTSRQSG